MLLIPAALRTHLLVPVLLLYIIQVGQQLEMMFQPCIHGDVEDVQHAHPMRNARTIVDF